MYFFTSIFINRYKSFAIVIFYFRKKKKKNGENFGKFAKVSPIKVSTRFKVTQQH